MSLATYLFGGWAVVLLVETLISIFRSLRLWRRKRAFRRLAEQLRRCAALHPIPTADTRQNAGE
jgi:hypothetical protein